MTRCQPDTEVIRMLADNPGGLDVEAKRTEALVNQFGVQEYLRQRKFRERLNNSLKVASLCWPECPKVLAKNGFPPIQSRSRSSKPQSNLNS